MVPTRAEPIDFSAMTLRYATMRRVARLILMRSWWAGIFAATINPDNPIHEIYSINNFI